MGLSAEQVDYEVSALKSLDHPHIVRIFEAFETDESVHIVMDYAEGGDLAAVLRSVHGDGWAHLAGSLILPWCIAPDIRANFGEVRATSSQHRLRACPSESILRNINNKSRGLLPRPAAGLANEYSKDARQITLRRTGRRKDNHMLESYTHDGISPN